MADGKVETPRAGNKESGTPTSPGPGVNPGDVSPTVPTVMIVSDPAIRASSQMGTGPGFQESCRMQRRSYRDGVWYIGDPLYWEFSHTHNSITYGYSFWFAGDKTHFGVHRIPVSNSYMKAPIAGGHVAYMADSSCLDNRWSGYMDSLYSWNLNKIKRDWNFTENLSWEDLKICEYVYLVTHYIYPVQPLFVINVNKRGTDEMAQHVLSALAFGAEHVPSISTYRTTVSKFFDTTPMAWHDPTWQNFAAGRAMSLCMSSYPQDGMCVKMPGLWAHQMWRQIVFADGGNYRDPWAELQAYSSNLASYYMETYLPFRTGLNVDADNREVLFQPGKYWNTFGLWMNPSQEAILISPALYYHQKQEWMLDPSATETAQACCRFQDVSTGMYPDGFGATPNFNQFAGYGWNFETVRPSNPNDIAAMHEVIGRRRLVAKPEAAIIPGGWFNSAVEQWNNHCKNLWVSTYPTALNMGEPVPAIKWYLDTTWKMDGVYTNWYNTSDYATRASPPNLDAMEDLMAFVSNDPKGFTAQYRGMVLRHPSWTDTYPNQVMTEDSQSEAVVGKRPYIPVRNTDLQQSLDNWMQLARFMSSDRKMSKLNTPST